MKSQLLGEILLQKSLITQRDLDQALSYQKEVGGLIGQALVRLGAIAEETLLEVLSEQLALPVLDRGATGIEAEALRKAADALGINRNWLAAHQAAIWFDEPRPGRIRLNIAAHNPLSPGLRELVDTRLWRLETADPGRGAEAQFYLCGNSDLESLLVLAGARSHAAGDDNDFSDLERLREMAEEAPVIDYVNMVFSLALRERASDIHIEPFEHLFHVRYRIDGVLQTRFSEPRVKFDPVASRVKLLSGMDIAERRLPQDGRQTVRFAGQEIDLRVSSLPGSWGESLVLRLLRKEQQLPDLHGLGLTGRSRTVFGELLKQPNGIILVTGPTGSGKSTTLYRGLDEVNDGVRKIITIEDPVEYDMHGITQIQVKSEIGYTFARGLRAILRQDPDVIMVGEIRDGETAQIAAQAALTGHLVFSTLHTNSALAAVARLVDIGLEPFLVAAALRGVAAQRLVRKLCPSCAEPESGRMGEMLLETARRAGAEFGDGLRAPATWRRGGAGCPECGGAGYRGRLAIFEIVATDEALHDAILARAPETAMQRIARGQGFLTMLEDGLLKARSGLTSIAEVMRVVGAQAGAEAPAEAAE